MTCQQMSTSIYLIARSIRPSSQRSMPVFLLQQTWDITDNGVTSATPGSIPSRAECTRSWTVTAGILQITHVRPTSELRDSLAEIQLPQTRKLMTETASTGDTKRAALGHVIRTHSPGEAPPVPRLLLSIDKNLRSSRSWTFAPQQTSVDRVQQQRIAKTTATSNKNIWRRKRLTAQS